MYSNLTNQIGGILTMLKQSNTELLPNNQLNITHTAARKVIASYAATFKELEEVCQLILEFSKEDATLNETKFIADIDVLISFGIEPLDLMLIKDEYEKPHLRQIKAQLQTFITCFNQLEKLQRIIIYYSYLKNESAVKIVQLRLSEEQSYSVRTFYRKNNEASILLVKKIRWHKIKHNF